jgi:hypothetical protein
MFSAFEDTVFACDVDIFSLFGIEDTLSTVDKYFFRILC